MGRLQDQMRYQQKPSKQTWRQLSKCLYSLFSKILEKEEVPAQWKEGIIIKLPKKDLRDCSNYRGIMLLSMPGRVLNRILLERMKEAVGPAGRLQAEQILCRPDRQPAHHHGTVTGVELPLYINFID